MLESKIHTNQELIVWSDRPKTQRAYPVQRAPALCGVWERMSVASLILACAM